jgi:predicted transposase YdaD
MLDIDSLKEYIKILSNKNLCDTVLTDWCLITIADVYSRYMTEAQREDLKGVKKMNMFYIDGEQNGLQKGEQIGLQIGLQKGEQIGLQKGEQIGLQKGRQEGRQEGRWETLKEIVLGLKKIFVSRDIILQGLNITEEQLQEIEKEIPSDGK